MTATVIPSIDEDIWEDVWDEERNWREEHPTREQVPQPLTLIIFGATGDLAHRKLIPALYHLCSANLLPRKFAIVGFGRSKLDDDAFRKKLRESVAQSGTRLDAHAWDEFVQHISYVSGQYGSEDSFHDLAETLKRIDTEAGTEDHRLFYLATPPNVYADVVRNLGAAGLNIPSESGGWARLIVEKPFGRDLQTAQQLDKDIHEVFSEQQVYRIDHYLGKETVQNLFVLRFINGIFEPLWNRNYVDHVQITASESIGVEGRGGYYDQAGVIRDMLQSHLLQLLTLTAMEPPSAFTGDKVRDEKVKVLDSVRLPHGKDIERSFVVGQYGRGMANDRLVPGYQDEEGVPPNSQTPTYVAVKLLLDNWRWAGVPFYLRTGKRLPRRVSEIAIQFRRAPHMYLPGSSSPRPRNNVLIIRIQPDDGLALRLDVKVPGPTMRIRPVDMNFLYKEAFGEHMADAYERLLLDAMRGDSTLFARTDEVETAWSLVTPLLEARPTQLSTYPAGSWGPAAADELLSDEGRRWRKP